VTSDCQIASRRGLAWLALAWERLWPAVLPALCVAGLFLSFALMDLAPRLPGWLHLLLLVGFAVAFVLLAWRGLRRLRLPDRPAARRRLEQSSGLSHRPLQVLEDHLADTGDVAARQLWQAHRRRAMAQLGRLRVGLPRPGTPRLDPWVLRAVVFLLLAIGAVVGGRDSPARLARAVSPDLAGPPPPAAELNAWINPPAYTGVAPVKLTAAVPQPLNIPVGSEFLGRLFGGREAAQLVIAGDRLDDQQVPFEQIDPRNQQLQHTLDAGDRLAVLQDGREVAAWAIAIVPDLSPLVELVDGPQVTLRNALRIEYQAEDDYGLVEVAAQLRLADADAGGDEELTELPLPLSPPGLREARDVAYHDLTPHPWAGLPVVLWLVARDAAGQEGYSQELRLVLPERDFQHPVAKAIIEQRKILVRSPEQRQLVALALSAIGSAPETYNDDVVAFLALRTAAQRLREYGDAETRHEMVELLWDTALRIEDGELSLAERELREAQQALMDALSRDADDREIERLMDELSQAMDRYLQALAERSQQLAQQNQPPQQIDPDARMVEAEDLKEMLERARELSRLGARDAAREMLRQLQEMLENLQSGTMQAMPEGMQQGQRSLRELGNLMQGQQRLLDRTFRQTPQAQGQRRGQRPGQQQQEGEAGRGQEQSGLRGLSGEQEALRRQLGEVMRQLGESMGDIPGALGRAERFMRDSRQALQQGRGERAVESQTEAIDQLAEGLQALAEQMMQQAQPGNQRGDPNQTGELDPLGRPLQDGGMDTGRVQIPDDWDLQQARRILEELRRRAGERNRPSGERSYIERLLRQF